MRILGVSEINVTASATSKWGNTRLRVALVLDNTGSMSDDGKMDALKTASKNLLTQLKNAAVQDGDVYVSIVPFSKDVNMDPTNYQASWLRWDLWDAANGTCSDTSRHSQSSCVNHNATWTPADHSTWNGCVTERGSTSAPVSDYDRLTTAPSTSIQASLFPAEQNSYCSPTIMGLSYSWSSMSTLVDSLYPLGATNQPIGLVWGWQSLVGGGPLTMPAKDPNYTYSDVIILLTDGLNTLDRWYGNGSSTSTSVDTRMYDSSGLGTCKNIKDSGVTIYAVQVNTGGDPTSTLLQNCASDSSKFFLLTSATQIITTFQAIGTNLTKLRIAQ